jgi:hypothetical protein
LHRPAASRGAAGAHARPGRRRGPREPSSKVAGYLLERLKAWGVEKVLGYPGDGINGLLAAWGRAGNQPKFIQARHEEMAAFEAVGYAKFAGRVGVCAGRTPRTSGKERIRAVHLAVDCLEGPPLAAGKGHTVPRCVYIVVRFNYYSSAEYCLSRTLFRDAI